MTCVAWVYGQCNTKEGLQKPAGLQKAVKSRFNAGVELCEACVLVDEGDATA